MLMFVTIIVVLPVDEFVDKDATLGRVSETTVDIDDVILRIVETVITAREVSRTIDGDRKPPTPSSHR